MGSGKTTFVRGAARQLGYDGPVTSPTYALVNRYENRGGPAIAHLDLHRLDTLGAEDDGLIEDSLTSDAIAFIEWPAAAARVLAREPRFVIRLSHGAGGGRLAEVEEPGS